MPAMARTPRGGRPPSAPRRPRPRGVPGSSPGRSRPSRRAWHAGTAGPGRRAPWACLRRSRAGRRSFARLLAVERLAVVGPAHGLGEPGLLVQLERAVVVVRVDAEVRTLEAPRGEPVEVVRKRGTGEAAAAMA